MLGSDVLDVVIALSFIFFLLSIVASAGQELISQLVSWRARSLQKDIGKMLGDPTLQALAGTVYSHPLISSLGRPSYLKNTRFADALIETLSTAALATDTTLTTVLAGIEALPDGSAKTQLQVLARQGGQSLESLRQTVAGWFDDSMERLSGAYKRNTQKVLLALGLLMAVLFNVDGIATAQSLAANPASRDAILASVTKLTEAGTPATTSQDAIKMLRGLESGIGWDICWFASEVDTSRKDTDLPAPCGENKGGKWPTIEAWINYAALRIPGWLLTALAVMLGAPFWFDTLCRLANLRATGKPETKPAGLK